MRNKCYLPRSMEEVKSLSDKKLAYYWDIFYGYTLNSRQYKYRPLWYAIQRELYNCKLAEKYITRLDKYAVDPAESIHKANKKKYYLAVGTILTKNYKGTSFQVTVKGEKAYEYNGEIYSTLSAVANKITGAHVSGPKFFGLLRKYI